MSKFHVSIIQGKFQFFPKTLFIVGSSGLKSNLSISIRACSLENGQSSKTVKRFKDTNGPVGLDEIINILSVYLSAKRSN